MTSSVASGRNASLRQRDWIVGSTRAGAWLTSRNSDCCGGSSRIFKQRVGGVGIEFVDGIDDADPPALDRRGRAEERNRLPGLVDGDHGPHHALVVEACVPASAGRHGRRPRHGARPDRMDRPQASRRVARRRPADCDGRARTAPSDRPASPCRCPARRRSARHAECARCDRHSARPVSASRWPNSAVVSRGCGAAISRLDLAGAHARLAALPALAVKKRSRKAAHTLAATVAGSALASISTQRCGSSAAICRYASRRS